MTDVDNKAADNGINGIAAKPPKPPESFGAKLWREVIKPYGEAILFALVITTFLFTLVAVDGTSMMPNLRTGERVFIPKYETWLHRVGIGSFQRGDILVFKPPDGVATPASFLGLWSYKPFFIKRLIGLPGDRVRVEQGEVFVNDLKIDQAFTSDYWAKQGCWDTESEVANGISPSLGAPSVKELTVPAGQYFVMGDNRQASGSEDSRYFGPIPLGSISGRATFVVWPFVRQAEAEATCGQTDKESIKLSGPTGLNWRVLTRPGAFNTAIPTP